MRKPEDLYVSILQKYYEKNCVQFYFIYIMNNFINDTDNAVSFSIKSVFQHKNNFKTVVLSVIFFMSNLNL